MKMKHIKLVLMMVCMLILAGCQSGKDSDSSQTAVDSETMGTDSNTEVEYQYSSALVDSAKTEGKMAVYFLRGDYALKDKDGEEEPTGEATLLVAPDGTTMLVDFNNCMVNGAYIAEVLQKLGIERLDYVVLTSPHTERLGGYSIVMHCVEIGQIITNHHEFTSNAIYNNFMKAAEENKISVSSVFEGDTFAFGKDVQVEVFNPAKEYEDWKKDAGQRDGALVLKFTYNQSSFLIGGDISTVVEEQLIAKHGDKLQSDVVKMNRQGSKEANTKEWIETVSPKIAVGERNVVDNDTIIGRYAIRSEVALHTGIDGTCLVYTSGDGTYEVQVEKERTSDTYLSLGAENGYLMVQ